MKKYKIFIFIILILSISNCTKEEIFNSNVMKQSDMTIYFLDGTVQKSHIEYYTKITLQSRELRLVPDTSCSKSINICNSMYWVKVGSYNLSNTQFTKCN